MIGSAFSRTSETFAPNDCEARREEMRHPQRHVAFLHRRRVADLEPALFHLRPGPAEMAGIERDVQTGERPAPLRGRATRSAQSTSAGPAGGPPSLFAKCRTK